MRSHSLIERLEVLKNSLISKNPLLIPKKDYLIPKRLYIITKICKNSVFLLQESVDTPVVERRNNKSWLTRTINRVGSIRSSSTTYSSGGIFRQARRNSTYSSPETGTLPAGNISLSSVNPSKETNGNHKMSFYDRLAGRKSGRSAKLRPGE